MTKETISKLQQISGLKVLFGEQIGADLCRDELPDGQPYVPEAVCIATGTQQVSQLMKLCSQEGVSVTVRGAGTGRAGACVPVKGGVVLWMKEMDQICSVDEEAMTMTVQPGALLQDVKAEAERHGLYYPPDPGEKTATIGGNVSTNASGPCAAMYGRSCDYVLDAELVLADGTVTTLSAREDLKAVLGSEGILAVITQLSLRLTKAPGADVILLLPFDDMETALSAAEKITQSDDISPAVMEYMSGELVQFSAKVTGEPVFPQEIDGCPVAATLMLSLEAEDEDSVMELMEQFAEFAEDLGCLDILVGDTLSMKRDFWAAHDAFHNSMESASAQVEVNVAVEPQQLSELISYAKGLGQEGGYQVMAYAHVPCGGVHFHAVSDMGKDQFRDSANAFAEAVRAKCIQLGGSATAEYGVGYANISYFKSADPSGYQRLLQAKGQMDPLGILNPGKVVE